jgi:hypothetical protein
MWNGNANGAGAEALIVDQEWQRAQRRPEFLKLPTNSRFLVSMLAIG